MEKTREKKLINCWNLFHNRPGWIRFLEEKLPLSAEEVSFLENYDDEERILEENLKRNYYDEEMPKVKQQIFEFEMEMGGTEEVKKIKKDRLDYLKKELQDNYNKFFDGQKKGRPVWLLQAVWELNRSEEIINEIKKIKGELDFDRYKGKNKRVSPAEIESALNKPTKDVFESCGIKVDKNFFANCPFHGPERTNSAYVRGSFMHCFGCGRSLNNIDFLMEYEKMTFPEAVNFLNRRLQ